MGVVGSQFNDFAILFPHSAKDSFVAFFSSALVVNVASPSVEIVSNFDLHYFQRFERLLCEDTFNSICVDTAFI